MSKLNIKLMSTVAAAALLLAPVANAHLMLQVSDNSSFTGVEGVNVITSSDTDGDGLVGFSGSFGSFAFNGVTALSSPAIGTDAYDEMDLFSFNVSGSAGTIYIRMSDSGFTRDDDGWMTAFGGTTDGTVSFQSYADASNTHFGMGTLLSDSGDITSHSYSGDDSGGMVMTGPYSMSIYATVTHTGGSQVSSFDYNIKVPEPSSLALLGIGLIGAGFASRRKVKKVA